MMLMATQYLRVYDLNDDGLFVWNKGLYLPYNSSSVCVRLLSHNHRCIRYFLKLYGHVHYFKTFCFFAEILSSLCSEFLKANVSAILYLMNYEKYGRSTASAQYFLQLAGYLGIPVIAWNADNSGLERVRCECWLYFKTICSFCLFVGSSLVPDTGWAKSRYTVIIYILYTVSLLLVHLVYLGHLVTHALRNFMLFSVFECNYSHSETVLPVCVFFHCIIIGIPRKITN
jgi:hypothetical protein